MPQNCVKPPICAAEVPAAKVPTWFTFQSFGGLSESEDRGGGDNSVQFIKFGRVGDKSFKEWLQNIGGWDGG